MVTTATAAIETAFALDELEGLHNVCPHQKNSVRSRGGRFLFRHFLTGWEASTDGVRIALLRGAGDDRGREVLIFWTPATITLASNLTFTITLFSRSAGTVVTSFSVR